MTESGDFENTDLNKLLAQEQEQQERIANEMLKSVKAIKENSLLANRIIKSDTKAIILNYSKNKIQLNVCKF